MVSGVCVCGQIHPIPKLLSRERERERRHSLGGCGGEERDGGGCGRGCGGVAYTAEDAQMERERGQAGRGGGREVAANPYFPLGRQTDRRRRRGSLSPPQSQQPLTAYFHFSDYKRERICVCVHLPHSSSGGNRINGIMHPLSLPLYVYGKWSYAKQQKERKTTTASPPLGLCLSQAVVTFLSEALKESFWKLHPERAREREIQEWKWQTLAILGRRRLAYKGGASMPQEEEI